MITIPYVKAHGARNDFLLTWRQEAPGAERDFCAAARAICERHTGAGADGWILLEEAGEADAAIELWNSDGSRSEISGNGTRCAAALLIESGRADAEVRILTGAGVKRLKLIERRGPVSVLEMNMGRARVEEPRSDIVEGREAVIVNVGNPQCAVFVADFDFDWRAVGAELERHPRFRERTNVSFVRVVDRHTLEVRFFERGAGPTLSSGTGSTGAAAAARSRGLIDPGSAERPVRVETLAGPLELRWEGDDILLSGPAEIVARGVFFWNAE